MSEERRGHRGRPEERPSRAGSGARYPLPPLHASSVPSYHAVSSTSRPHRSRRARLIDGLGAPQKRRPPLRGRVGKGRQARGSHRRRYRPRARDRAAGAPRALSRALRISAHECSMLWIRWGSEPDRKRPVRALLRFARPAGLRQSPLPPPHSPPARPRSHRVAPATASAFRRERPSPSPRRRAIFPLTRFDQGHLPHTYTQHF